MGVAGAGRVAVGARCVCRGVDSAHHGRIEAARAHVVRGGCPGLGRSVGLAFATAAAAGRLFQGRSSTGRRPEPPAAARARTLDHDPGGTLVQGLDQRHERASRPCLPVPRAGRPPRRRRSAYLTVGPRALRHQRGHLGSEESESSSDWALMIRDPLRCRGPLDDRPRLRGEIGSFSPPAPVSSSRTGQGLCTEGRRLTPFALQARR